MNRDASAAEPLDRLAVERVGNLAVAEQRARLRPDAERPVRPAGLGSFVEPDHGVQRDVGVIASSAGLYDFGERPTAETEIVVGAGALGGCAGIPVATEAVVQHR